jgi:hypothetical protein
MSETIIAAFIAGLGGFMVAAIPAYLSLRDKPSRRIIDTAAIVDASGVVISTLREELTRLDRELDDERKKASLCMKRIDSLSGQLRDLGVAPINGK